MLPWEEFLKKYNSSPQEIRDFIDSDAIPTIARELSSKHLSKITLRETVIVLTDFVLNSIDKKALEEQLGVDESGVSEVLKKIDYLLSDKTKPSAIPKADGTVKEELELRPEGVPRPQPIAEEGKETPKPLTREDVLSALASRRTMASDIESVKKDEEEKEN